MALSIPGKKKEEPAVAPAPLTRLEERRDVLREQFSELQWDLGGAAYEMAARDYFRLDVLASLAAKLQLVDAELAEIERMARLEKAGAAGACSGCGSLFARGAIYCWRCGRNLNEKTGTVIGPSVAGQITMPTVPAGRPVSPEPPAAPPVGEPVTGVIEQDRRTG
ncbi:MAG: hypothetical protein ACSLFD_11420 [Solirubrobacterales bacterium]